MPFAGFEDFDECVRTMTEEEGHDEDSAESICGALQAEAKSDHGNVDQLREALEQGAGLIADVGVDLVSGVDVPAVDSKWTMMKSTKADLLDELAALAKDDVDREDLTGLFDDDNVPNKRVHSPHLLSKQDDDEDDEERRISYAAAMIPREPDKEGDVVATPTVEKAAHDFLTGDGGVDTDHSLIDGDGEVVESWVLKEERTFDLPDGGTETYGAGTWMVGIKWAADAWERIKSGELTGLSIYGMAEHVALSRSCERPTATAKQLDIPLANESVVHLVYESRTAAEKASDEIGLGGDVHEHEFDGMAVWMPGETHEAFVERYMELSDEASEEVSATKSDIADTHKGNGTESEGMAQDSAGDDGGTDADGDTGTTTDDGPTLKDLREDITSLTESVEETVKEAIETEKQDARDAAAILAEEFDLDGPDAVIDAVQTKADDMDDEEDDEEEDKAAETETAEKRADDANLSKGSDGTATAQKGVTGDGEATSGAPSFSDAIAKADAED